MQVITLENCPQAHIKKHGERKRPMSNRGKPVFSDTSSPGLQSEKTSTHTIRHLHGCFCNQKMFFSDIESTVLGDGGGEDADRQQAR